MSPLSVTTTSRPHDYSGHVWIQQQSSLGRNYWSRRYLVLDGAGQVLHLYDTQTSATRKANSATKKNRILLRQHESGKSSCQVKMLADVFDNNQSKKEFVISVLDGQVEWHLSVETSQERTAWVDAILVSSRYESTTI
jgi:hypothetical protein